MSDLTPYDREVLKEIAQPGSGKDLSWGAAMSVTLEWLQGQGYATRGISTKITDKGRAELTRENSHE
jgi:hypothetical protein